MSQIRRHEPSHKRIKNAYLALNKRRGDFSYIKTRQDILGIQMTSSVALCGYPIKKTQLKTGNIKV